MHVATADPVLIQVLNYAAFVRHQVLAKGDCISSSSSLFSGRFERRLTEEAEEFVAVQALSNLFINRVPSETHRATIVLDQLGESTENGHGVLHEKPTASEVQFDAVTAEVITLQNLRCEPEEVIKVF